MPVSPGESFDLAETNILQQAQALALLGLNVFPVAGMVTRDGKLVCECGRPYGLGPDDCRKPGKHPMTKHGHLDASRDPDAIHAWFSNTYHNLAYATGNGIVVIDVDKKGDGFDSIDNFEVLTQGITLPRTRTVDTGSGGLHLIFQVPRHVTIRSRNRVLPGIDIKGDGGYVIAPPSIHASGSRYRWRDSHPTEVASPNLLQWLVAARGSSASSGAETPTDYSFSLGGVAGQRDAYANDLAFRLRKAGLSWERAEQKMRESWEKMEQPEGDEFTWNDMRNKLVRVWSTVQPDHPGGNLPSWPGVLNNNGKLVDRTSQPQQDSGFREALDDASEQHVPSGGDTGGPRSPGGEDSGPPDEPPHTGGARAEERPHQPGEHPTDLGNTMRFVRLHRGDLRFSTEENRWYRWDGNRLKVDTLNETMWLTTEVIEDIRQEALIADGDDRDRLRRWALSTEAMARRTAMVQGAEHAPGMAVSVKQLDVDPWKLVVANGTLDLQTQRLVKSEITHLNTKQADVTYDPDACCPAWEKHVAFVAQGDPLLIAYLQRACGYSLTGLTSEQKFFFLYGGGQNGKNVFTETLIGLLGDYGSYAQEGLLTSSDEHPTALASLRGARLVMADETSQGKRFNDSRIKMLTGSAKVRARYMRQDFFEFDSTMKLWILGNNKPGVKDSSDGMWRRMQLVPFLAKIPDEERVPHYEKILAEERSGILNWCLAGLAGWIGIGGLGAPEVVLNAVAEYRKEEDVMGQFFEDCCEFNETDIESFTASITVYHAFKWWALTNGVKDVPAKNVFGRDLCKAPRDFLKTSTKRMNGRVERGYIGLKLRENTMIG